MNRIISWAVHVDTLQPVSDLRNTLKYWPNPDSNLKHLNLK